MNDELGRSAETITAQAAELVRLHGVEVEHAALKKSRKTSRIITAVCGLMVGAGSGITKFSAEPVWLATGFSVLVIAALVQFSLALLDG